jgi:hypothetical protein
VYTVEVYKLDRRVKTGERLITRVDHSTADRAAIAAVYSERYPAARGYRFQIYETWVTRKNAMTGAEFRERYDTPWSCSPSSESFWSM